MFFDFFVIVLLFALYLFRRLHSLEAGRTSGIVATKQINRLALPNLLCDDLLGIERSQGMYK